MTNPMPRRNPHIPRSPTRSDRKGVRGSLEDSSSPQPDCTKNAGEPFVPALTAAKENVICLGPSGTGKTHIATALGMAAIEAGCRVRFIRAVTLAQELLAAQQDVQLNRYLKSWAKFDLVICDELGYLRLGPGAPLFFQFVACHRRE